MVDVLGQLPVFGEDSVLLPPEHERCATAAALNLSVDLVVGDLNGTAVHCLEHAPQLTRAAYTRALVLGTLAALSLVGNLLTIYSIYTSRQTRRQRHQSAMYSLIMHLSVADLLVTVFCLGGEAAWSYAVAWPAGNAACKLFKFLEMFSLYLSTFVLVLIGVDRFVAVRYPIRSLGTAKWCNRLVACAWALSALLSAPQTMIFHEVRGPFFEEFYQCVTYGFYSEPWQEQLYTTVSFMCMFILPLLILISTYVSTFITISQSDKTFQQEAAENSSRKYDINRRRLIHRAKVKSFRISVVIVAAFIVWWTPYYCMMIIFMFLNPDKLLSDELQKAIFFFGMSNSLVNPVIYGAFHMWRPKRRKRGSYRDGSTQLTANSVVTRLSRVGTLREDTTCVLLTSDETETPDGRRRRASSSAVGPDRSPATTAI